MYCFLYSRFKIVELEDKCSDIIFIFLIFYLQYIQQNIRTDCSNIDRILEPPEGQDEGVWKYEHLRYVVIHFLISVTPHTFLYLSSPTVE